MEGLLHSRDTHAVIDVVGQINTVGFQFTNLYSLHPLELLEVILFLLPRMSARNPIKTSIYITLYDFEL